MRPKRKNTRFTGKTGAMLPFFLFFTMLIASYIQKNICYNIKNIIKSMRMLNVAMLLVI